jgi:hypothetical protein
LEISTLLNILSTVALVGALIFAALQVRSGNRLREEQAAFTLIDAALNAVLAQPADLLSDVSPDTTAAELDAYPPEVNRAIQEIGFRIEIVGYLVYRRVVPLQSVQELMGGMIAYWWARIRPFAERDRERTGNPRLYEWVQWLAERVSDRRTDIPSEPAYIAHADWR